MPVYALNLFDVADRAEYLAYARESVAEVAGHGGRVVALGKFDDAITGDVEPRQVMILVEWESREACDSCGNGRRGVGRRAPPGPLNSLPQQRAGRLAVRNITRSGTASSA